MTRVEANSGIFDYIERFYTQRQKGNYLTVRWINPLLTEYP